jgi:SOS-response transcriptional repressor LexA
MSSDSGTGAVRGFRDRESAYQAMARRKTGRRTSERNAILIALMERVQINQNQLATAGGWNRQTINKLVGGQTAMSPKWARLLSPHLRCSVQDILGLTNGAGTGGRPQPNVVGTAQPVTVGYAEVRGDVACGRWLEADNVYEGDYPAVPIVPTRHANLTQTAFLVVGPSMDRLKIDDGDYVVCVPFWEARRAFETGDVVVVERRNGALIERTCKQVELTPDAVLLWPRSTDARYQEPYRVPLAHREGDETEIEAVGLVVGLFRPM